MEAVHADEAHEMAYAAALVIAGKPTYDECHNCGVIEQRKYMHTRGTRCFCDIACLLAYAQ